MVAWHQAGARRRVKFQLSPDFAAAAALAARVGVYDAEIHQSAEWQAAMLMPTGDAPASGYYLTELPLKLLARDDWHPCA
jgi:hypothetical protein